MENHFDKPRTAQHCAPIPALGWGLKNIFGGTIVGDLVGNCGDERSDRDRSKTAYYDTLKAIENLKATPKARPHISLSTCWRSYSSNDDKSAAAPLVARL